MIDSVKLRHWKNEFGGIAHQSFEPIDMALILGKRKRRNEPNTATSVINTNQPERDLGHAQDLFRKHFEATFEPIEKAEVWSADSVLDAQVFNEPDSDWEGLSSDETAHDKEVTVIEHGKAKTEAERGDKEVYPRDALKGFMVWIIADIPPPHIAELTALRRPQGPPAV